LTERASRRGILRGLGPGIIVGSVVFGPGSILTSAKVGCDFGYDLMWVVAALTGLMIAMTALSARLGVTLQGTLGEEIARRAGRPAAAAVGVVLFLIVACFQFTNNAGVLAAISPLMPPEGAWPAAVLIAVNGCVAVALLGFRRLYNPVEKLMKLLVGLMIVAFSANVFLAAPPPRAVLGGLAPSLPQLAAGSTDPLLPVAGLVATTFSVAAAFYQSYLVRAKGWRQADLGRGLVDAAVGISILGALSTIIMVTAAAVLHGQRSSEDLTGIDALATMLEPTFGRAAMALFCVGLLAGAFSSFLVNVMIGGLVMSDGFGLGGDIDGRWPRAFTVLALLIGMAVALVWSRTPPVTLIVFAQALTVLGNPVLAGVLLWLGLRPPPGGRRCPAWMLAAGAIGFVVVVAFAAHRAATLLS
jgi:Mn2+/Fe2+ NRAMP family transporter